MTPRIKQGLQAGETLGLRYSLQVPQRAMSGLTGAQIGRRSGSSIDFQDYREYQPGDDVRLIDWAVYARSDRLSIRLFREEVTPHLDLIVDGSRSMDLDDTPKGAVTAKLAAVLAVSAANAHCTQAVWMSGEGFRRIQNDTDPPSSWGEFALNSSRTADQAFDILGPRFRRLSLRVFISDLLWPGNPAQTVRRLAEGAAGLFVIQVLSKEDSTPPEHGTLRLVDSETDELLELYVDSAVGQRYLDTLRRHQQEWETACRQCGAHFTTLIAENLDDSLETLQSSQLLTAC